MKNTNILISALMVPGIIPSCEGTQSGPEELISLKYPTSPVNATVGTEITDIVPTLKPDGATATYTINPALSAGLTFNANSGVISGTPEVVSPSTHYTVTAKGTGNYGGEVSGDITIEVYPVVCQSQ